MRRLKKSIYLSLWGTVFAVLWMVRVCHPGVTGGRKHVGENPDTLTVAENPELPAPVVDRPLVI